MVAELASMEDIRALSRNKLEVSRFDIDALLEKHGFSSSRTIQRLDGNFTNLTLDVETQAHGRVFLKMQFRRNPRLQSGGRVHRHAGAAFLH